MEPSLFSREMRRLLFLIWSWLLRPILSILWRHHPDGGARRRHDVSKRLGPGPTLVIGDDIRSDQ
jgi:hypothetical protein